MPNILINPESGFLEFNTGSASGSAFDTSLSGAARLKFQNSGELNLTSYGTGVADKFTIDGSNGRLFSVNNTVTGSIFSVNDVAGLPIVEVFSDDRVVMGQYATNALVVSGSGVSFGQLPTVSGNPVMTGDASFDSDTLQTVTDRGATTTNAITLQNNLTLSYNYPRINLTDTDNDSDYSIINNDGSFGIYDVTNSAYRLQILSGGNVGIGTNSPDAKLDVAGGLIVSGDATWAGTDNLSAGIYLTTDDRGIAGQFSSSYARNLIKASSNYIDIGNLSTSLINGIRLYAGSTTSAVGTIGLFTSGANERMHISKSGNVGIGTNAPTERLEVYGDIKNFDSATSRYVNISNGSDIEGSNHLLLGASASYLKLLAASNSIYYDAGTAHHFRNGGGTERVRIEAGGDVGIGTDSPDSILHLDSDGATVLTIESDNDNNDEGDEAAIHLLTDGGLRTAAIAGGNATYETAASGNFNALNLQSYLIRFHTAPSQDFDLASEKMRLTPAGNLGIGTTNPQYNLEIYSGDLGLGVSSTGIAKLVLEGDIDNIGDVGNMDASIEFLHDAGAYGYRISTENWGGVTALNFDHNKNSAYTNVLHLGTGGNVGIGTNDPAVNLHVESSSSAQFKVGNGTQFVRLYADADEATILADGSVDMRFYTAGAEKMRLDTDGNVGIGTNNPAEKLDVAGGNIIIDNGQYLILDGGGAKNRKIRASYDGIGHMEFIVDGTDVMDLRGDGSVGIGTDAPDAHLHIYKNSAGSVSGISQSTLVIENNSANAISMLTPNNTSSYLVFGDPEDNQRGYLNYDHATDSMNFKVAGSQQMTISGSNVGIGTANPLSRLDVKHQIRVRDSSSDDTHAFLDSNGTDGRLRINNGANWGLIARGFENSPAIGAYFLGNLRVVGFSTSDGANVNNELARFDFQKSGVGIGSNVPAAKLDVAAPVNDGIRIDENNALLGSDGTTTGSTQLIYWNGTNAYYGRYTTAPYHAKVDSHFFRTNGSNQLAITTSGVGIGTATPAQKLHVDGGAADTYIKVRNNGAYKAGIEYVGGSVDVWKTYLDDANNTFRIEEDGTSYLTVSGGGNVGIGTDTPPQKLSVKGTITHLNSSNIQVASMTNSSQHGRIIVNNSAGVTKALIDSDGDSYFNGGNVGINDSTPIGDLQVGSNVFSGGNGVYADSRIGLSVNGGLKSIVYASTYNNAMYPDYGMVFIHGAGTASDYNVWSISPDGPAKDDGLNFIYGLNATNIHTTAPKVVFKGDGKVGIGTDTPAAELDVDGVIKHKAYAFSSLPTKVAGMRAFINDSYYQMSSSYFGYGAAGGGSYFAPVWTDGAYWYYG